MSSLLVITNTLQTMSFKLIIDSALCCRAFSGVVRSRRKRISSIHFRFQHLPLATLFFKVAPWFIVSHATVCLKEDRSSFPGVPVPPNFKWLCSRLSKQTNPNLAGVNDSWQRGGLAVALRINDFPPGCDCQYKSQTKTSSFFPFYRNEMFTTRCPL